MIVLVQAIEAHTEEDISFDILTHSGLVMPFGDIDLGQHWLR